jgi:hypothetical protein
MEQNWELLHTAKTLKEKVYKAGSALMTEESAHVKMKGALDL